MKTLDNIKPGQGRLYIPAIYNSGRKACVRVNLNEPDKIHIAIEDQPKRPYQLTLDGYLHINAESLESSSSWQSVDNCKKVIDIINKHFFSGSLTVFSDDEAIVDSWRYKKRTITEWVQDVIKGFTNGGNRLFMELIGKKLTIFDRFSNAFQAAKKRKERIKVVETLNHAHLGGSWQNYSESNWIIEAEKMSESKIYLA